MNAYDRGCRLWREIHHYHHATPFSLCDSKNADFCHDALSHNEF